MTIPQGDTVSGEGVRFFFSTCRRHNCSDEECDDYADIAKKIDEAN